MRLIKNNFEAQEWKRVELPNLCDKLDKNFRQKPFKMASKHTADFFIAYSIPVDTAAACAMGALLEFP